MHPEQIKQMQIQAAQQAALNKPKPKPQPSKPSPGVNPDPHSRNEAANKSTVNVPLFPDLWGGQFDFESGLGPGKLPYQPKPGKPSGGGGGDGYTPAPTPKPAPPLIGTSEIKDMISGMLKPGGYTDPNLVKLPYGDMYGLTYDANKILDIFNNATAEKYKVLSEDYAATENKFLNQLVTNQDLTQQTIRDMNSAAVANGASQGMVAANQLSALLGGQQQGAEGALELANEGNKLKNKEAAERAENASKALDTSNNIKNAIAQLDLQKYGYDTQFGIGQMDYSAALNDAIAAIISAQINAKR